MNQPTDAGIYYDPQGNLQILSGWNYMYDAQNRLMAASDGVSSISFYYDGKNRQVARAINGAIRFSVWDDWELLEEYTMGNVRTAAYLQGAHGPVKSLLNTAYYFYQDSLGSTSHIASSSGALLEYYKYDLYGKPTYWNASGNQIWVSAVKDLFSGERWIPEISMYDLRNRFYSPDLGRFLQPDPIGFKGDGSNLYRYCGNDWANRTDPMGLYAIGEGFAPDAKNDFERAQQEAAHQVEKAADKLEHALEKGGKELSNMSKSFDKVFGNGAGTQQNMTKILKAARTMVTALRDRGALGYVAHGRPAWWFSAQRNSHGRDNVLGVGAVTFTDRRGREHIGKDVWINIEHPKFDDRSTLRWAAAHESAHNAGAGAAGIDVYKYKPEYQTLTPEQRLDNADSHVDFLFSNSGQ